LLASIPARLLVEWMAYERLEPFERDRIDLAAGVVASTLANLNRDPKRRRKAYTPQDFMPLLEKPEPRQQSWEEQLAIMKRLSAAHNRRVAGQAG